MLRERRSARAVESATGGAGHGYLARIGEKAPAILDVVSPAEMPARRPGTERLGAPGPQIGRVLEWACDLERESKGLDHRLARFERVLSAIILKRLAASPQTSTR